MNIALKVGLLAALLGGGAAQALELGATRMNVIAELGAPTGFIRAGKEETLYYARGNVQLRDGKVVDFEIVSPEQLRERQAAAEKARLAQAARNAELRAQLKTEGELALKNLLADPDFVQANAAAQVARWREFMQKYPDVAVSEYYLPALKRLETEQARNAQDQRLAVLEQRVQEAEQRALQNDTSKMQYPSVYIIRPSLFYPPMLPCPNNVSRGPTRDAVSGNLPRMYGTIR